MEDPVAQVLDVVEALVDLVSRETGRSPLSDRRSCVARRPLDGSIVGTAGAGTVVGTIPSADAGQSRRPTGGPAVRSVRPTVRATAGARILDPRADYPDGWQPW